MDIYQKLKEAMYNVAEKNNYLGSSIEIKCKALSSKEAIGTPDHNDYPIQKGKEVMVEAEFMGAKGQAFSDSFENRSYTFQELVDLPLDSNAKRASFISALNALWKHIGRADKTVHCRDQEPVECARHLGEALDFSKKTLLVGLQPRFLEVLSINAEVRVLDLDQNNIGTMKFGITIEDADIFPEAVQWCEQIFSTGSTICNDSLAGILQQRKPTVFFGVTIAAAADILGLNVYCHCGH